MRKILFCFALLFVIKLTFAQTEHPNYKTAINKFKKYYNNNQPDSLYNMFDVKVKAALPLQQTKTLITQMQAQIGQLKQATFIKYVQTAGVYKAAFDKETLLINLSLNGLNEVDGIFFNEYKAEKQVTNAPQVQTPPAIDPSVTETPITLKTLAGTISGALTIPKNISGKLPVVLIIAGSGPTDRNGNGFGFQTNAYKLIAEALGKAGIATLRYDKRGIGQSTTSGKEADTRFTDFVDDAGGLISMLKEDKRFSKIIILGHSEGSLIGMLAAKDEDLAGYISVAGAGESADKIVTEQLKSQPPSISQEFKNILDTMRKGKVTPRVDPALYALARPSIQPYLMSWFRYDPAKEIKKLKLPILIIQGTTDIQVTVANAEKLKKAKSEAVLKIIDGMNHILKAAPADRELNKATYNNPSLPLKPEFVTAVVDFIKGLK